MMKDQDINDLAKAATIINDLVKGEQDIEAHHKKHPDKIAMRVSRVVTHTSGSVIVHRETESFGCFGDTIEDCAATCKAWITDRDTTIAADKEKFHEELASSRRYMRTQQKKRDPLPSTETTN